MFSEFAPIIPYISMGNIELGRNIDDVVSELKKTDLFIDHRIEGDCYREFYDIERYMTIGFMTINRKIDTLYSNIDYKGGLREKIYVGMSLEKVKETDSSLVYIIDNDEYVSLGNGYIIRLEDNGWIDVNVIEITLKQFFPSCIKIGKGNAKYDYLKENKKNKIWESGDW